MTEIATDLNWLQKLHRFGPRVEVAVDDSATPTYVQGAKQAAKLIVLTGALTAAREVILPLEAGADWSFKNATTGGYAVTVKGPTGASVPIAPGATQAVVCDGPNLVAVGGPGGVVVSGHGASGLIGVYSAVLVTTTQTLATFQFGGDIVPATWLFEVDFTGLSDDGQDGYAGKFIFSVCWNSTALSEVIPSTSVFAGASGTDATPELAISGTTVVVKVTGVTDWRWTAAVRMTRTRFS